MNNESLLFFEFKNKNKRNEFFFLGTTKKRNVSSQKNKTLTSLVVIVVNCHLLDFNRGSWVLGSEIYFVYIVNKDAGTRVFYYLR